MKYFAWIPLGIVALTALAPLRADTDGRFLGRPISIDGKARPVTAPQAQPAPRPLPLPEPRPAPLQVVATAPPAVEARSCCNMRLLKQMPAEVSYGQEFMYQLQVFATENVADIVVRDSVPEGAVYVRSEPPARVTGNVLEWTWSEMDAGQVREIRVWLRPEREGRLGSCATVHAVSRACAFTVVGRATLSLTKTGPATAAVGEDIPYNIVVANSGNSVAKGVVVTDTVPSGLAHATGQSTLTFNVGDLGPNQSRTIPVVLRGMSRGRYCNLATATSANAAKASAEACTAIVQPGLQVTKTGPTEQFIGKNADYTITVMNVGDTLLSNVTVVDTTPQVARIITAAGASVAGTQAGWRIPELQPGERKSFTLTLTTATAGTHVNGVTAAAGGLTAQAQAATLWRGLGAMLVEVVDSPDPILIGGTTTYTIRITNQGSADLMNVSTTGSFPREITPTAAQNGTITGSTVRFQTIPRIGVGQSATFTATGRGAVEGDGRVKFSFTEDSLSSPVIEEESTRVF
ncbi:MAG: DUF11 domain-containing protein [Verrucomicrobia bacterium]|nr:DUF11 domain-containing protein [Verrucomicrobiota bacterium]